jgi:two-component system response regulator MprA
MEFSLGNLKVNTETCEITLGDKYVHLTRTEFDLLVLMIKKPNKVFSPIELAEEINVTGKKFENIIRVYMCYIRRKIPKHIYTFRGFGYKIK